MGNVNFYIKNNNKKTLLENGGKMLRNVSDLMLASVSHYVLEGKRFGPKFAPIRTAVCFSLWWWGGGACEHSTIDLLVCSGFIIKTVTDRY